MTKKITKLSDLIPDDNNYNRGTEFGNGLIGKSLSKLGAGRSILLDKNGKIIAGNKTVENAVANGMDDIIVVQTDGKSIVAVQRMDLDLDTKRGKEMALADNASAKANIEWNHDNINADGWSKEELDGWGVTDWSQEGGYSDKNKEIDVDGMESEMTINLKYTPDEYWQAKEQLSKIAATPEQAVWILLGNETPLSI